VQTKLKTYSGKQLKYCWHDHTFSPIIGANLTANYSDDVTKTQQSVKYLADKATWEGYGLELHSNAHYNSGSNSFDDASIELFSRNTVKESSPANDTVQAGFGFKTFRTNGTSCSRPTLDKKDLYHNQYFVRKKLRGVQFFTTWDMAFNDSVAGGQYDSITDWRDNFRYICNTFTNGMMLYLHDDDFTADEQQPGVSGKHHGYTAMQLFTDTGTYLKDVAKVFADPTNYVP
jgi:hypothetical protein